MLAVNTVLAIQPLQLFLLCNHERLATLKKFLLLVREVVNVWLLGKRETSR